MPAIRSAAGKRGILALLLLLAWLAIAVGSRVVLPPLLGAAYDGKSSSGWLNEKIKDHAAGRMGKGLDASRQWYVAWGEGYAVKGSALATLFFGAAAVLVAFPGARWRVRKFLFASSSPTNLAVLRIAAFGMLLYLLRTEPILTYAAWPRELFQWPALAGLFYKFLPISVEVASPLLVVAMVTSVMAIVGLLTRSSALVSVLLGYYLIGIPQLSGKVNHLHHVLLIGLVLALSRCGDALSIDSLFRAIGRADRGLVAPPRPAVRYGMPIRVAMLVLVTAYFFPGFWKVASNGPQWVFSGNLENHMLQKWFELEHYTPPIPLHELPLSGPMGALFAVVFELFFPLALLWRPTRAAWGAMGLLFHNLTNLLMNISFVTLQVMYVTFVDWRRVFAWVGKTLFGEPMRVLYDGNCGLCRRTLGVLGALDWFGALRPVNALDRAAVEREDLDWLSDDDLMTDMHAAWRPGEAREWEFARGYGAYQALAWRVPMLWPLVPILGLWPVTAIGRLVYRKVADSRACRVPVAPKGESLPLAGAPRWSWKPLAIVAGTLLAGQCLLGAARIHKAWPIACYPLFDQIETRRVVWPEFEALTAAGEATVLDDDPIRDALGDARYVESMRRFVAKPLNEEVCRKVLTRFADVWREAGALPAGGVATIRVALATYELTGPARPTAPSARAPLMDVPFADVDGAEVQGAATAAR
ncbi:MAG: DCC1-like thiol-disulfide oxidoreductase family protein [Lacipirellulaceae bacterium]